MTASHPFPAQGWPEPLREAADLSGGRAEAALSLSGAMKCVRRAIAEFSEVPLDAIVSCERTAVGWEAVVDPLEAPARPGDNDMLGGRRLTLTAAGEPLGFTRPRRYRREDGSS